MSGPSRVDRHDDRLAGYTRWVLAAVVLGAALRIGLAISDDVLTNDATAYLRSGASIWAGDGFRREGLPELHFPPAYPVMLGGLAQVFDPLQSMVLLTLVASTSVLVILASLARRLAGDRAAIATVFVAAVVPGLTDVPVTSGSGNEMVFLLLVLVMLRLTLAAHDASGGRRQLAALGAGLTAGLAYLTRPEGLLYVGVAVAILTVPVLLRRATDWRPRALAVALLLLGLAVSVVPYASYLHDHTGRWELTAKASDASIASWRAVAEHDREARDAVIYELDADGTGFVASRATLAALAKDDPKGYLGIIGVNLGELWDEVAVPVEREHRGLGWALVPIPLSVLAMWGAWRRRRDPAVALVLLALAVPTATALGFFVQARYLIPATAMICLLVGIAFVELPRRALWPAIGVTAALLVASFAAAADGSDGLMNRREPVEHRIVGEWLDAHTSADARIMTRSMIVEYYADRRAVPVPYADVEEVMRFARHHGVDYIVVDRYMFSELRPQLLSMLETPPPGTTVVHRLEYSGRPVVVLHLDVPQADSEAPPGLGFMGDG